MIWNASAAEHGLRVRPAAVEHMAAVLESSAIIRNMARTPEITVAAVTETEGRFLVVEERINRRLVFNQPAGHVEEGETLLEAVVREVREETAWGFEPQALIGVYLWKNPCIRPHHTCVSPSPGRWWITTLSSPWIEASSGTHWLSRDELRQRGPRLRSPLVLRCIEDYLGGTRRPLEPVATLNMQSAHSVPAVTV